MFLMKWCRFGKNNLVQNEIRFEPSSESVNFFELGQVS